MLVMNGELLFGFAKGNIVSEIRSMDDERLVLTISGYVVPMIWLPGVLNLDIMGGV